MNITKNLQQMIKTAADKTGGRIAFSQKSKISSSNITKYISGGIRRINNETWEKLQKALREYFSAEEIDHAIKVLTWDDEVYPCKITASMILKLSKTDGSLENLVQIWITSNPIERQQLRDFIETWQSLTLDGRNKLLENARNIWGQENPNFWK